ncbi:MAG: MFS transporter [Prevotellaceae bacterium]|jgi:FHS family L-fucose permease-like MFS transporter|nr:MFS transporter [Prevotellaceae bacterium]
MTQKKQNGNVVAIIMMIALFGMIGFVTNLAAPAGTIWKSQYAGSNFLGMLGNLMNFAAYLVMGIPAGKLLTRIGYKKTALFAIVIGFAGIGIQFCSGIAAGNLGFAIYLSGAFIAGICVCMLNTVVNPMLNEIGGGGKKGGALLQAGGACNSLLGTLAPILVGALIGEITKDTAFSDVNLVLFIAMGIFAVVGIVLYLVNIPEPDVNKSVVDKSSKYSAWSFRHFVLGAIGIFIYVGVEVGIPGTMKFFLESNNILPAAAGTVAGTYWFLMLVGRLAGAGIARRVSSKILLTFTSSAAIILVLIAIFTPTSIHVSMPVFTGSAFAWQQVPVNALFLVLVGLCTSVMWGGIFNLAVEGLGKYVTTASGIFMMMVVGGGILPLIQNWIVDITGGNFMISYLLPLAGLAYLLLYALAGSKNVNRDIPVE